MIRPGSQGNNEADISALQALCETVQREMGSGRSVNGGGLRSDRLSARASAVQAAFDLGMYGRSAAPEPQVGLMES